MFALKRIDLRDKDSFTVDPQNEVKVLKSLDHPNIIKYYDTFVHNSKLCILMEYADNADLSRKIKDYKLKEVSIEESQVLQFKIQSFFAKVKVLQWFTQLCLAVQYLHAQKILHRDIKVQNVFLNSSGLVKLGDFGISKTLEDTHDLAQTSIGTPYYLSPEICDSIQYNHKIDIWMLGCTLYELCSLHKPFSGDSINAIVQKIMYEQPDPVPSKYSRFVIELVEQLLEKDPNNRPEVTTILQMPQMQREVKKNKQKIKLQKLKIIYNDLGINILLPIQKMPLMLKLKSESTDTQEQGKQFPATSRSKQAPQTSSHKMIEKSPVAQKMRENSIHQLVEQSKLQRKLQSPINVKKSARRTPTNSQLFTSTLKQKQNNINLGESHNLNEKQSISLFTSSFKPVIENKEHSESALNSPHFKQLEHASVKGNPYKTSITDNDEDFLGQKHKSYQRLMSINTQLEMNVYRKEPNSTTATSGVINEQKTIMKQSFAFGEQMFDPNAPASPNRTILFSAFLKRKLGDQRFQQMKMLLESSANPIDLLDNQKARVASIIGNENLDCIKMFKFLITNSVTPSASHFRTKSAQIFNLNDKSNTKQQLKSSNENEEGGILELLKDMEQPNSPKIKPIGLNEGFEISFKNFKDFEG